MLANKEARLLLIAFLFLPFSQSILAQDSLMVQSPNIGQYIVSMDQYLTMKLALTTDMENFSVYTNSTKFEINPNASAVLGLSANYSFLSVSAKFTPSFFPGNGDNAEKGKTKNFGLALNLNFNHWLQELSFTRTKGYYLNNTKDFNPGWEEGDPHVQFPDLVYKNFQGITGYKFNSNYSLNAVATQSERQLASAGSFIPQLLYRYFTVDDRTKITMPAQATQYSKNFELILGAGYYHTIVLQKQFYIALGITPGVGYLFTNFTTRYGNGTSIKTTQENPIGRIDTRAGVGYNGERFFGGLYATAFTSTYKQENTNVVNGNARVFFKLFAGYRIPAPTILKEKIEQLNNKIKKNKHS